MYVSTYGAYTDIAYWEKGDLKTKDHVMVLNWTEWVRVWFLAVEVFIF